MSSSLRSGIGDSRVVPVENLALNPSFERVNPGTTVVRRNLAVSPRGAITPPDGSWALNPYWFGGSGNSGVTTYNEAFTGLESLGILVGAKKKWTAISGASQMNAISFAAVGPTTRVPVTPGKTYTISLYWKCSWQAVCTRNRMIVEFYDVASGGTKIGNTLTAADSPAPAINTPQRISITVQIPTGVTYVSAGHDLYTSTPGTPNVNDELMATGLLVEERPALLPYFDGSTTDTTGIVYAWEGTANASTSVAKAGVIEAWRNIAQNPKLDTNTTGWSVISPAGSTGQRVVGGGPLSNTFEVSLPTGTISDYMRVNIGSVQGQTVTPGSTVITVSMDVYTPNAATGVYVEIATPTATGTLYNGTTSMNLVTGWNRFIGTFTVPAASTGTIVANSFKFIVQPANLVASTVWKFTRVRVSYGVTDASYFDGSITPDADFTPSWTGTADASESVLYGVSALGIGSGSLTNNVRSWQWGSRGPSSIRLIPKTASNDTYVSINGDTGAIRLGMQPGGTYTVLARIRLTAAQTGSLVFSARRIRVVYKRSSNPSSYSEITSNQPANSPGETSLRFTFTLAQDTIEAFVRLMNGASATNGEVWWDQVAVIQGIYTGPYIDGDMPGCIWRGVPHNSTSTGYPPSV